MFDKCYNMSKRGRWGVDVQYEIKAFGQGYHEIVIYNENWLIAFSDLGARINRWQDAGKDLILASRDAQEALNNRSLYPGATVGRVAGRIAGASFNLNGKSHTLLPNEGSHHLHGGDHPLDLAQWDFELVEEAEAIAVVFTYEDPDQKNGYPGNLRLEVTHRYQKDNTWTIQYKASCDQDTLFNPTNHVYFNLIGDPSQAIDEHLIKIESEDYLPINGAGIPLGQVEPVSHLGIEPGQPVTFGHIFNQASPQVRLKSGLDHAFILQEKSPQVEVYDQDRQYHLQLVTDQESLVVYTVNDPTTQTQVDGKVLTYHGAFTLEAQNAPDAIHWQGPQATVLRANTLYQAMTRYQITKEEGFNESQ